MGALVTPIPPHTGIDPPGVHHPYSSVLASREEVTLHQVTCDCTLLYITVLLWVTQGARADEDSYLQRA